MKALVTRRTTLTRHPRRPAVKRTQKIVAVMVAMAAALLGGPFAQAANPAIEGAVFAGEVVSAPAGCSTDPASGPAPTIDWGDQTPPSPGVRTQNRPA